MSDALSEIALEQERGKRYEVYLRSLIDFLKSDDKLARDKVVSAAKEVDSVNGGYRASGSAEYSKDIEETLTKLAAGDHGQWAKQLAEAQDTHMFPEFKALSPFKDRLFICIRFSGPAVYLEGDVKALLRSIPDIQSCALILPPFVVKNASFMIIPLKRRHG